MWYRLAAKLDEVLEQLNIGDDIKEFLGSISPDKLPHYVSYLKSHPQSTLQELKNYEPAKKQSAQLTASEQSVVNSFRGIYQEDAEYQRWVQVQLRKIRAEQLDFGEFRYRPYADRDQTFNLNTIDQMFINCKDWFNAKKQENPAFEIASYDFAKAHQESEIWHDTVAGKGIGKVYEPLERDEKGNIIDGRVVYQFPDGWTIQQVNSENDLQVEGYKMNHCIDSRAEAVEEGEKEIYSLRDEKNYPHATIEMTVDSWDQTTYISEIEGNSNQPLSPEYKERVKEWLQSLEGMTIYSQDADMNDNNPFDNRSFYKMNDLIECIHQAFQDPETIYHSDYEIPVVPNNPMEIDAIYSEIYDVVNNIYLGSSATYEDKQVIDQELIPKVAKTLVEECVKTSDDNFLNEDVSVEYRISLLYDNALSDLVRCINVIPKSSDMAKEETFHRLNACIFQEIQNIVGPLLKEASKWFDQSVVQEGSLQDTGGFRFRYHWMLDNFFQKD